MADKTISKAKKKEEIKINRNRNAENAIEIARKIVGIAPVKSENIVHYVEKHKLENTEAEKLAVIEHVKNYLGMEITNEQIVMTKLGKTQNLYVQFNDKEIAFEVLRRGNMAMLKNQEVKVSNYIPPQCYNRWSAAWSYAKNIEQ